MATSGGTSGATQLLVCRAGAKLCGFPLAHVLETMRPLAIEPLAQMPAFVLGVAVIRGRPTPVVDTRLLLGSASERPASRYVTLGFGEHAARVAAFAVDSVIGVRLVQAGVLGALPTLLGDSTGEVVQAFGALDTELLVLLEHARLLPDTVWQAIEERRSA